MPITQRKIFVYVSSLVIIVLIIAAGIFYLANGQSSQPVKVAFFGDQGMTDNSKAVLKMVKGESADMVLHVGDFDYKDSPEIWDKQITDILGQNFPYLGVVGNHEEKKLSEYMKKIQDMIDRSDDLSCHGVIGLDFACDFRGIHFVLTAPGINLTNTDGSSEGDEYGYNNIDHAGFIKNDLSESQAEWNICAWHKNQKLMQVGKKIDEVGWQVYEECRKAGAMIATGHEHSYSRTYLMDSFEQQITATTSKILKLEKEKNGRGGKSFAFVSGLGGSSSRAQSLKGNWWASIYTSEKGAKAGALFCTFQKSIAVCYFKDISGKIVDEFQVESPVR